MFEAPRTKGKAGQRHDHTNDRKPLSRSRSSVSGEKMSQKTFMGDPVIRSMRSLRELNVHETDGPTCIECCDLKPFGIE
jgi:hypothetical protein